MDSRKVVFRETALVVIGEALCIGVMLGVFALLGKWDKSVWLGALFGGLVTVLNFLFMAIGTSLAADRAADGNVKGGQGMIRVSFLLRYAVMFIVLFAGAKSGLFHVIALVLPLAFVRPILTVGEFFRKKGDVSL